MKRGVLPIPVEEDIDSSVRQAAEATGLKLADVMRQGLRHGVPAFIERLTRASAERAPKCLSYLDEYPRSPVSASGYKAALRNKVAAKHGRPHR